MNPAYDRSTSSPYMFWLKSYWGMEDPGADSVALGESKLVSLRTSSV
jgi:hypothetical protein